jgi:hypothetical protein
MKEKHASNLFFLSKSEGEAGRCGFRKCACGFFSKLESSYLLVTGYQAFG